MVGRTTTQIRCNRNSRSNFCTRDDGSRYVNQPMGLLMKHYILGGMIGLCMFYISIGDMDRMSRAIERRVEIVS